MPPSFPEDGLRAAMDLRRHAPQIRVLVLSQFCEPAYVMNLIGEHPEGIGHLLKERVGDVTAFVDAVTRVAAGGSALDPEVVARMLGRRKGMVIGNASEILPPEPFFVDPSGRGSSA